MFMYRIYQSLIFLRIPASRLAPPLSLLPAVLRSRRRCLIRTRKYLIQFFHSSRITSMTLDQLDSLFSSHFSIYIILEHLFQFVHSIRVVALPAVKSLADGHFHKGARSHCDLIGTSN
jgi:hypothetical protein